MTVFIDTAVLMYAAGDAHPLREPCTRILDRVARNHLDAVTSVEVVQEIMHRYLALRRTEGAAALAEHTLDLFAPVLPVTHGVMRRVPALISRYPSLGAREGVHVATCLHEGITEIISPDRGFDGVEGLRRIDPSTY